MKSMTLRPEVTAMTEYQIQPNTRRCATTGRELRPGEKYFSALIEEGDHFLRRDYSADAWQGPPQGAFGFWGGKVPTDGQAHKPRFDDDLLADCFLRLEGQTDPGRVNFRYVVALLLMRRKRFKFEQSAIRGETETIGLRCVRTGERYEVVNPRLNPEEMAQVQEEVFKVLGWE
jgi:hypothetical protein